MASTYLTKTFSSSPTGTKKCTISMWIKRSTIGAEHVLFSGKNSSNRDGLRFDGTNDQLRCFLNGASSADMQTNRVFRDVNAWYHIVIAIDTTQGTASNRMKMYINGVQETSFTGGLTYPPQDHVLGFGSASLHNVGRDAHDNSGIYDGSMSHVHFIDGTAYDASAFGSTDSTTGEWKINTSPSVTYGTNGFFILKDGNTITDSSTNSNAFTLGAGTLTKTEDNPSNVFATFLPFVPRNVGGGDRNPTFSNGNTTASFNNSSYNLNAIGSIALKGKYYWETKWVNAQGDASATTGIVDLSSYDNAFIGTQCVGYEDDGTKINEGSAASYGSSYTSGDIIGTAFDSTTGTMWFSKNGTWQNSATISEIAAGTTANSAYTGLSTSVDWLPLATNYQSRVCNVNFGNGYFGTTAVSSAGTNASGNGIFEYDVPTGYTALSTKGLNT
jgi:hypothetical protein